MFFAALPRIENVLSQLSSDALITHFEGDVRARIDEISGSLSGEDLQNDTARFLRGVRDSNLTSIRPVPVAAQRTLAKTRNPDISINQLVQVIEKDPTLGQALP